MPTLFVLDGAYKHHTRSSACCGVPECRIFTSIQRARVRANNACLRGPASSPARPRLHARVCAFPRLRPRIHRASDGLIEGLIRTRNCRLSSYKLRHKCVVKNDHLPILLACAKTTFSRTIRPTGLGRGAFPAPSLLKHRYTTSTMSYLLS